MAARLVSAVDAVSAAGAPAGGEQQIPQSDATAVAAAEATMDALLWVLADRRLKTPAFGTFGTQHPCMLKNKDLARISQTEISSAAGLGRCHMRAEGGFMAEAEDRSCLNLLHAEFIWF